MAIPMLTFVVTDPKTGATSELNHIKDVKRSLGINETISLNFRTVDRPSNTGYSLVKNENIISYGGHNYKIKQVTNMPNYKTVVCTHEFSDLVGTQRYENVVGTVNLETCLSHILWGTGWTYTLVDSSLGGALATFGEDQWGKGNAIKLLETICDNVFKIQFQIMPNKVIHFTRSISSDKGNKYEYGVNIKTISENFDSTALRTQIRGTYEVVVGQDEDGNDITQDREVVYTSPNASIFGIIEADPISDNDVKTDYELYLVLQDRLEDEIRYSLDIAAVDLKSKELGETVTINYPKMGIVNSKSKILKLDERILWINNQYQFVPETVTLGNYVFGSFRTKVKDKINKLEDEIEKLKRRQSSVFFLSSWKIGTVNALALPNVVLPSNAKLPEDITAEVQFEELQKLIGQKLTLKNAFSSYHVTITEYTKTGNITYSISSPELVTKRYPYEGLNAISVTITDVPPEQYEDGKHRKQVLGVKFNHVGKQSYWIEEFKLGTHDCLESKTVELTAFNQSLILDEVPYKDLQEITGLFVKLKQEFTDYDMRINIDGTIYTKANLPTLATRKFPLTANSFVMLEVSKDNKFQFFGVKFLQTDFLGVITIKNRDENGSVFSINEQIVNKPGKVTIQLDDILGYELVTKGPIEVELTWEKPEVEVYVDYVTSGQFTGKITIRCTDENGKVIQTRVMDVFTPGDVTVYADVIPGYDLTSASSTVVTLTLKAPEKTVYFRYLSDGTGGGSPNGYVLEFGSAPLANTVTFTFSNPSGYDSVESVVPGIIGRSSVTMRFGAELITNPSTGKYIGVRVDTGASNASLLLTIQAVCYNGG